jgi:hypothetical protein
MRAGSIPSGRIRSPVKTDSQETLFNSFVQSIGDAMREQSERPSIMYTLAEAAEPIRRGSRVWYDFSHIRPHGL